MILALCKLFLAFTQGHIVILGETRMSMVKRHSHAHSPGNFKERK